MRRPHPRGHSAARASTTRRSLHGARHRPTRWSRSAPPSWAAASGSRSGSSYRACDAAATIAALLQAALAVGPLRQGATGACGSSSACANLLEPSGSSCKGDDILFCRAQPAGLKILTELINGTA